MDDASPLLVDTGRGLSIRYRDRWLYSRRDPAAAPSAASRALSPLAETLYLLPSPCLCYGVRELLAALPASSAALCVEADDRLLEIAAESLPAASDGLGGEGARRIAIATPERAVPAYRALEAALAPSRFRRVVELRLSGGRELAPARYDAALSSIDADIALRFRNRLSLVRMGRLWTKNVIANLGAMRWEDSGPLSSAGRPVVVCGAGPSLDGALEPIRRHRDRLFVLACDTASGALAAAGVEPDAVVCLEGQVYNVGDFLPLGGAARAAVVDLSAHPSSYRALCGAKALTLSEWSPSGFLSRLARAGLPVSVVPPLGSVGVLALHVAKALGGHVLVAGLDFSFRDGTTHCSGSPADLRARRLETRTEKRSAAWAASYRDGCVRGADGSLSDPALSLYAALAASELRDSPRPAADLRGGFGAPLPLVPVVPAELGAYLDGLAPTAGSDFGSRADPALCRERARAFLRSELGRAELVADALRNGPGAAELGRLLADADFLYAHFPDPERVERLEADALRRAAAEAAYWRGRLESALA